MVEISFFNDTRGQVSVAKRCDPARKLFFDVNFDGAAVSNELELPAGLNDEPNAAGILEFNPIKDGSGRLVPDGIGCAGIRGESPYGAHARSLKKSDEDGTR